MHTIGIIGAGPVGLAALKSVLESPQFKAGKWDVITFEAKGNVGGLWLPTDRFEPDKLPSTPIYDSLTTNLPHPLMAYSCFPFPPSTLLYPPASTVQAYFESFADHFELRPYIRFNTRVLAAGWDQQRWIVTTESETHEFDLLLVCNGHYSLPHYPSTPGISSWIDSKRAFHSAYFRNPSSIPLPLPHWQTSISSDSDKRTLKDLTVLVVGGGPSGQDITHDLLPFIGRVLHSTSSYSPNSVPMSIPSAIPKPRPTQFIPPSQSDSSLPGTVLFEDGSQDQIDFCILATGYQADFPFFDQCIEPSPESNPPKFHLPKCFPPQPLPSPLDTQRLYNTTYSVFPLAHQFLAFPALLPHRNNLPASRKPQALNSDTLPTLPLLPAPTSDACPPTLAFLGLLIRVAPFPLVEVQARLALELFAAYSERRESGSKDPQCGVASVNSDTMKTSTNTNTTINWDWDAEARLEVARYDALGAQYDAASAAIASTSVTSSTSSSESNSDPKRHAYIFKKYPRFEPMEQYDYREALEDVISSFSCLSPSSRPSPSRYSPTPTQPMSFPSAGPQTQTPTPNELEPKPEPKPSRLASHRALYAFRKPLRSAWRAIEARGEAAGWVRGVGEVPHDKVGNGGSTNDFDEPAAAEQQWIDLMWRVLAWWEEQEASK